MGCGESKHALATENTISKSKSKNSDSNRIAINSVEEKENLIKEPGVDVNVEEKEKEKENAKVIDNGKGESRMEENAILTDNGNGKSEGEENVKEKEEKLDSAPVVIVEGKSDEISVHQVEEPEEEKLKRENGKIHLNDDMEGKAINQEVKEDSKNEEAIKVEGEKEVVLPIAETKDSATKGE